MSSGLTPRIQTVKGVRTLTTNSSAPLSIVQKEQHETDKKALVKRGMATDTAIGKPAVDFTPIKPRNNVGAWIRRGSKTRTYFTEYVLSTVDKVVNWARQGSMWPMVGMEMKRG